MAKRLVDGSYRRFAQSKSLIPPTRFWVLGCLFISAAIGCTSLTREESLAEIEAAKSETRDCSVDAACVAIRVYCPFGCFVGVHEEDREELQKVVDGIGLNYSSEPRECNYACPENPDPRCIDGRCEVDESILEY